MFGLNPVEMLIVGVVAILLFGSRLPTVARSLGKSMTEFRRGMNDLQHEFRSAMNEADEAARAPVQGAQGRLPNAAEVAHDEDPPRRDDSASDSAYDSHVPETDAVSEEDALAAVDRREEAPAPSPAPSPSNVG
ncbi:Sec-independent protein translocase subunit TatA/TatB [Botrimarina mediterranea]|uniref:Sec-independent protein translocase protein TatA n=1 Tax=Botrimarina mediterranea TaxID=2528022 RepID=A0A518KC45_9BACT|nr:twin-arginine translocase TatA/TatE family subunit [Botrimarina mediterranea]QDV75373.1 twin arginine translocase protein A [Botrimarina mediterranea]QDV80043.1 twin arginine translocase protein A [Planctomycetes bacterium K2D]